MNFCDYFFCNIAVPTFFSNAHFLTESIIKLKFTKVVLIWEMQINFKALPNAWIKTGVTTIYKNAFSFRFEIDILQHKYR